MSCTPLKTLASAAAKTVCQTWKDFMRTMGSCNAWEQLDDLKIQFSFLA